jgi:hypothetical protein
MSFARSSQLNTQTPPLFNAGKAADINQKPTAPGRLCLAATRKMQ